MDKHQVSHHDHQTVKNHSTKIDSYELDLARSYQYAYPIKKFAEKHKN